jgi:glutamate formiminotransferase/formiminotetrahydrofolate cyclodeaminase
LRDLAVAECLSLSHRLAARVSDELAIPVYLYGKAAQSASRVEIGVLRRDNLEGLKQRMRDPLWKPDYGPMAPHPTAGALLIGVRDILIAYNVNLTTLDLAIAVDIAKYVRESGVLQRDSANTILRDLSGAPKRVSGLPACRALGWVIPEFNCAQVSLNLLDYRKTGVHEAFLRVRELALDRGVDASGSELVGLMPREALLLAGRHFAREAAHLPTSEAELYRYAIKGLGLAQLSPFIVADRILEEQMQLHFAET